MSIDQFRQPAGTPVGGQFAATAHAEPEVALSGRELEALTDAYLEEALWTSPDAAGHNCLLMRTSVEDFDPDTRRQAEEDVAGFLEANAELVASAKAARPSYSDRQVVEDFWLTRNGHGAGFWDRGLGDVGEELANVAKAYGSVDLHVGDDGKVRAS